MSNKTIIARILGKLNLLEEGKITYKVFCSFLENSISALEGIPYQIIKESSDFEYEFTMAQFADEEDCEYPTINETINKLKTWLTELEKKY